jgi:hypothetical protein
MLWARDSACGSPGRCAAGGESALLQPGAVAPGDDIADTIAATWNTGRGGLRRRRCRHRLRLNPFCFIENILCETISMGDCR